MKNFIGQYHFNKVFEDEDSTKINIVNVLNKYVSDFTHIETGKNLDQKM